MTRAVGANGEVVIEEGIRDRLGAQPGWQALQIPADDHVKIYFIPPAHNRSLFGAARPFIRREAPPEEEWDAGVAKVVAEEWLRKVAEGQVKYSRGCLMKRDEVLQSLANHRDQLARFGVRSLALFGSVARDEAGSASDVDLLIEFEGAATFDRYVELGFYLEDLLGCRVDLITRRSLRPSLRASIEKDSVYVPGLSAVPG